MFTTLKKLTVIVSVMLQENFLHGIKRCQTKTNQASKIKKKFKIYF